MSSRRLLVLLKHPRENGPYARALRDGGWPPATKMLAEIHKELALYRAAKYAGGDNEYSPLIFVDPLEAKQRAAEAEQQAEFRKEAEANIFADFGWRKGGD